MSEGQPQYEKEMNIWLKTLDYLQQENIHLKTRLAEILQKISGPNSIEKAECFQNDFLNKDTVIAFLRRDITLLQSSEDYKSGATKKQQTLRADMQKMEREFNNLKAEFHNYMIEIS